MGDNLYLGDRNGVRTPMQWTGDRNAGFSRADPARLYSPVVMDPVYGYQAVNVEAQESDAASLLHWMRNMIRLRKQFKVFGRGTMEFLSPANGKVLAYVRRYRDDVILCVANLSRTVQPARARPARLRRPDAGGDAGVYRISDDWHGAVLSDAWAVWLLLVRTPAFRKLTSRPRAPTSSSR